MTADIKIGAFKPVKPNAFNWKRSIDSYSDTAVIKLPAIARLKKNGESYGVVQTGLQFTEGMKVECYAGYNGNNALRFKGFVRRVNFSVPLEIECEGYSYQLRKKRGINFSKKLTTAKELLTEIIKDTDIVLDPNMPKIEMDNVVFKNFSGTEVLDYMKDKALLTIYFNHNVLYCGLLMGEAKATIKHRLNWNVIDDAGLKFNSNRELSKVTINVERRNKDGTKSRVSDGVKGSEEKIVNVRHIRNEKDRELIAKEQRRKLLHKGYEGALNCFLIPVAETGMGTLIDDVRYPERNGLYFIEKIEGSFDSGGGRQKIHIGAYLGT